MVRNGEKTSKLYIRTSKVVLFFLFKLFLPGECETKQALTRDNMEEKREMIKAIPKDRIISEIPKLTQVFNLVLPNLS